MANKQFEKGKKYLLEYLDNLARSKKAALIEEKDEDYCERHETYTHSWDYKLNEGGINIGVHVGPIGYSTDYKTFEKFVLTIDSADNNNSEKLMNDLEKMMKKEEKADKRVKFWRTAAAIAGIIYASMMAISYAPKAYNYVKDGCCKVFSDIQNSYFQRGLR